MPQQTPEYIHVELPTVQQLISMGLQYIEEDWDNAGVTERAPQNYYQTHQLR